MTLQAPAPTHPAGRDGPGRVAAGLVTGLVLVVGMPLLVVDWRHDVAPPAALALALSVLAISGIRLSTVLVGPAPELLTAFFHVFVYVFFGLAALAQVVAGAYPGDMGAYDDATVVAALSTVLVGVVAYELGRLLRRRPARAPAAVREHAWLRFSPARSALVGAVGLVAVGYQVRANGLGSFFVSRAQTVAILNGLGTDPLTVPLYRVQDKALGLVVTAVTQGLVLVALFVILYSRRNGLWQRPATPIADGAWRAFIALLVVANLVVNNPIGTSRVWFCLVVVAFLSIYLPFGRARSARVLVVVALLVLVFLFSVLDAFRVTGSHDTHLSGPAKTLVQDDTYGMFQMELATQDHLATHDHTGGRQLLGAVLVVVPRSLWPDKPIATGQLVDPRYLRSTTLWSELEVDFGLPGVAAGFLLLGAGSAALTRRAAQWRTGPLLAVFPVVAVLQIFVLRGSLVPATGLVYQLAATFAVVALHTRRQVVS